MNQSPNERDAPVISTVGSANIAARLRRAILGGKYSYRERLPAERELADFYQASRGTIREALRQLTEMGLLVRRVGSGTFVTYQPSLDMGDEAGNKIAEITSPLELIEARLGLEPQMVRLAVINATGQDLQQLKDIVERMEGAGADRDAFSQADEAFHLHLATCSHNRLIIWLYRHLNKVRSQSQWNAMRVIVLNASTIKRYNREHRAVYEALVRRNVDDAVGVIIGHLERIRQDLLRAVSQ